MPIKQKTTKYDTAFRRLLKFLTGEHSGDALRNSLTALVPALLLYYFVDLHSAISIGVGILMAALTDLPGNRTDKWISAKWCISIFAIASLLTSYSLKTPYLLLCFLTISAFLGTMLAVYGSRAAAVGSLTLILISFIMGLPPTDPIGLTVDICLGAGLYYLVSILQTYITPYRSLRHAMAGGFHNLAVLIRSKSECYNPQIPIEKTYKKLSKVHVQVSESQEVIRLLLLREKQLLTSNSNGSWLNRIYGLIDLHELLTALDYDYDAIRETLEPTQSLPLIQQLIIALADEVEKIGHMQQLKLRSNLSIQENTKIKNLLAQIELIREEAPFKAANVLKGTLHNVKSIIHLIQAIQCNDEAYFTSRKALNINEYQNFIPQANKSWASIKKLLTFDSALFTFAFRLAILFGLGGAVGLFMPESGYAYWVLLTLAIVARPSLRNTKLRNTQRIIGTLSGMLIAMVLLYFINDIKTALSLAAIGLFGFFFFNRPNYMVSVIFITVAVLLALNSYHGNLTQLLGSRLFFTFTGTLLAIVGCYFLPLRQKQGMSALAKEVVRHSRSYFQMVAAQLHEHSHDNVAVRMARKNTQTILATFSDTIHQLQTEPGHKKQDWTSPNTFHSLAYRINALTIGLAVNTGNLQVDNNNLTQLLERSSDIDELLTDLTLLAESV